MSKIFLIKMVVLCILMGLLGCAKKPQFRPVALSDTQQDESNIAVLFIPRRMNNVEKFKDIYIDGKPVTGDVVYISPGEHDINYKVLETVKRELKSETKSIRIHSSRWIKRTSKTLLEPGIRYRLSAIGIAPSLCIRCATGYTPEYSLLPDWPRTGDEISKTVTILDGQWQLDSGESVTISLGRILPERTGACNLKYASGWNLRRTGQLNFTMNWLSWDCLKKISAVSKASIKFRDSTLRDMVLLLEENPVTGLKRQEFNLKKRR